MRECRSSGSVEGAVGDHDSYSDYPLSDFIVGWRVKASGI